MRVEGISRMCKEYLSVTLELQVGRNQGLVAQGRQGENLSAATLIEKEVPDA